MNRQTTRPRQARPVSQELPDGTVVWTSPVGMTCVTTPAGVDLFPELAHTECAAPTPRRRSYSRERTTRITRARRRNRALRRLNAEHRGKVFARKTELDSRKFRNEMRYRLFAFSGNPAPARSARGSTTPSSPRNSHQTCSHHPKNPPRRTDLSEGPAGPRRGGGDGDVDNAGMTRSWWGWGNVDDVLTETETQELAREVAASAARSRLHRPRSAGSRDPRACRCRVSPHPLRSPRCAPTIPSTVPRTRVARRSATSCSTCAGGSTMCRI